MPTLQLGGPIGPFLDNVQQRNVPVSASGTCDVTTSNAVPDVAQFENHVRTQLLGAIRNVIGAKMAGGQLTFRNLGEGTLGTTLQEIIGASGLAQQGIQIGNLALRFAIDDGPPQREVRANINVGGFHVQASSTGGVNAGSLANQALDKAKSALLWYVIGAVLVAVIGAVAWWYVKRTVHKAIDDSIAITTGADIKWDGSAPLTCTGSQNMRFENVTAKLTGTAVSATGSCTLTLVNCNITGGTAVEAIGSAIVTIQGGSITGTELSAKAIGSSEIHATGAKVTGKTQALGSSKITGM